MVAAALPKVPQLASCSVGEIEVTRLGGLTNLVYRVVPPGGGAAFWPTSSVVGLQLKALLTVTPMSRLQTMPILTHKIYADLLAASFHQRWAVRY